MKILMTLMGLDIGGAETHVMELTLALRRQGHEVLVASGGGVYVEKLQQAGVRHVEIPMNSRAPVPMARSLRRLKQLIRQEQPDLVHAHARIPAFLCGILQKQMHFPFLTTAHWVFAVTPLLRHLTDWGARTVAVSEDIKDYLRRNYQVPEDQIHVTVNGIDTDVFAPELDTAPLRDELGLGEGPVVCLVSRLDESRALAAQKLIGAFPALRRAVPKAQLLIVGGGNLEQQMREMAEAANREIGENAVVMTGPRTDVAELAALSTVFVGVSRAALEAMSEAKPVILAGDEGYLGLLTPEKLEAARATNFCCRDCPALDGTVLRQDVQAALELPEETRQTLGEFGRSVILEHYSVERMTRDYLDAYEKLLHSEKPLQAVISGYYGYGNLGDDAILLAIGRQLSRLERPIRLTVLSRQPQKTRTEFGLPAVNRFAPFQVLRALRRSDLLISGGGSLLQDKTSARSLRYYLAVIRLARLLKKPVFLYANGIGPLERKGSGAAVRRCLEGCGTVTLRDGDSLELLRSIGVGRQDLTVTADPVFSLKGDEAAGAALRRSMGIPAKALLGVSVRPVSGLAEEKIADLCDRVSRQCGVAVVFLVMQESGDESLSRRIQAHMQEPSYLAKSPGNPEAMMGLIGQMDALIATRLHAVIFAAAERVPVAGFSYDPKVSAFLKQLGLPDLGAPEDLEPDRAFAQVAAMLETEKACRAALGPQITELERQAEETPRLLEQMLCPGG